MPTFRDVVALGVGAAIALSCVEVKASENSPSLVTPERERQETQAAPVPITPQTLEAKELPDAASTLDPLALPFSVSVEAQASEEAAAEPLPNEDDAEVGPDPQDDDASTSPTSSSVDPQTAQAESEPAPASEDTEVAPDQRSIPQSTQEQKAPAPESLNPSANPLQFPTQAGEVQVQTTQVITLEQALELARRNNRDLEEAQLSLERTRQVLREALAAEFPTAGVSADVTRTESDQQQFSDFQDLLGGGDTTGSTTRTTVGTALELNYNLYTGGQRAATIRSAEEQIRFQQLEVERLFEQLRLDVFETYYDLQEADAQVEIGEAAVSEAAQSLRDAQLQEQAGLGTRFDVLQAQVQLANANQDLVQARSQQRVSRREIVRLLSLGQAVEVSAADPIEVAGDWELSLEQSIVLAVKNRAELEQQLVQRNIGEQQRRIALAAIRPQASLFASYGISADLDEEEGPDDTFSVGARLQWNFFDGGAARARSQQAETDIAIAETRFAAQRNQVRFDVEQSFFTLSANEENIQTASFALESAIESLRLARLRFDAGVGTQLEVLQQQTALTEARVNQLQAILDYNRALAALQRSISNLPDSNLSDLP